MKTVRDWSMEFAVRKYEAAAVEVLDTPAGRVLRPRSGLFLPRPLEVVRGEGNLLLNAGIARLESLLIAAGGQGYDATHSRIGVGDDNTAAVATQTDLVAAAGSSHRQFEVMDATYPLGPTSQVLTWRSTFTSGEANFHWQEWGIDPGTAAGTAVTSPMLNRKVTDLGTKVSTTVWQFTATLTIS